MPETCTLSSWTSWDNEPGGGSEPEVSHKHVPGMQGIGFQPGEIPGQFGPHNWGKHYEHHPPENVAEKG
jgi:hypothetical protein